MWCSARNKSLCVFTRVPAQRAENHILQQVWNRTDCRPYSSTSAADNFNLPLSTPVATSRATFSTCTTHSCYVRSVFRWRELRTDTIPKFCAPIFDQIHSFSNSLAKYTSAPPPPPHAHTHTYHTLVLWAFHFKWRGLRTNTPSQMQRVL